jgi:hypothetical protein
MPGVTPEPAGQKGPVNYPPDHQPGMAVPKGGSSCANCEYLGQDQKSCTEKNFIAWNGSNVIPGEIDAYCSDWYEPAEEGEENGPEDSGKANAAPIPGR